MISQTENSIISKVMNNKLPNKKDIFQIKKIYNLLLVYGYYANEITLTENLLSINISNLILINYNPEKKVFETSCSCSCVPLPYAELINFLRDNNINNIKFKPIFYIDNNDFLVGKEAIETYKNSIKEKVLSEQFNEMKMKYIMGLPPDEDETIH